MDFEKKIKHRLNLFNNDNQKHIPPLEISPYYNSLQNK